MRTCAMCPNPLTSTHHTAKYCSSRCKYRAKDLAKGLTCHRCGKGIRPGRSNLPQGESECQECRTRCGTVSGYRLRGCRCALCKEAKRLDYVEYTAQRTAREGVNHLTQRKRIKNGVHPFIVVECVVCGLPMSRVSTDQSPSPTHKGCKVGYPMTTELRLNIYGRDEWKCKLCLLPVVRNTHHLRPDAASLDHIVPQSHGGSSEPENLRLAHRWCNSRRGNGDDLETSVMQALFLEVMASIE